jgi:eukaryotic-like serine/threonine-protein kinase
MVGRTVGKYRILDRIGRGGMGTVYLAEDETLSRHVAIKVLNPDLGDAEVLRRFRAEAVTLARLSHPGIATIYELHRQQDDLLMVMEYVRGETFHDLADRVGRLDPPQAAHLCIQVLDALGYAHRAGVIHRDLKPANLMVTETGAVKVMDFGIARVLGTEHFTMNGMMMGTPAYMAPEQVNGDTIDARADLYAVGVVFYRLLTGRLPFLADTAIAMVQKHVSEEPTPVSTLRPGLPAWCAALVRRALAKRPEDRFQTAEEFRQTLLSVVVPQSLGELPTLATPTPGMAIPPASASLPVAGRTAETPTPSSAIPPADERTTTVVLGPTHLVAIAALVLVLCAGIVVLAFAAFRSRSAPVFDLAAAPPAVARTANPEAGAEPPPATAEPAADAPAPPRPPEPPAVRHATTGLAPDVAAGTAGARAIAPAPAAVATATPPVVAVATEETTTAPDPAPLPTVDDTPVPALPSVAFGNVRVVTTDGDTARVTRGMLRIGNGTLAMGDSSDTARVLSPLGNVRAIFYSRSRQPRWRDAEGREAGSRVDLGKMGFLRGDRNWLILLTDSEPVILSVEDGQLRQVSQAIEARTGRTVQRF